MGWHTGAIVSVCINFAILFIVFAILAALNISLPPVGIVYGALVMWLVLSPTIGGLIGSMVALNDKEESPKDAADCALAKKTGEEQVTAKDSTACALSEMGSEEQKTTKDSRESSVDESTCTSFLHRIWNCRKKSEDANYIPVDESAHSPS